MKAALITPPIGFNLNVVQGIQTRGGKFNDLAKGATIRVCYVGDERFAYLKPVISNVAAESSLSLG